MYATIQFASGRRQASATRPSQGPWGVEGFDGLRIDAVPKRLHRAVVARSRGHGHHGARRRRSSGLDPLPDGVVVRDSARVRPDVSLVSCADRRALDRRRRQLWTPALPRPVGLGVLAEEVEPALRRPDRGPGAGSGASRRSRRREGLCLRRRLVGLELMVRKERRG